MNNSLSTIVRNPVFRFTALNIATSFASRTHGMVVVLGDCEDAAPFWVVTMADAQRLEHAGYELA